MFYLGRLSGQLWRAVAVFAVAAVSGLILSGPSWGLTTAELQAQAQTGQWQSAQSQQRIDGLDDQILTLRQQYRSLLADTESLEQYNGYLATLVADQEQELSSITKQIADVRETRQGIVPLMLRMVDGLERFVAVDKPFLSHERMARVDRLRTMLGKADISEAEKMRRLLEAFQIEGEYGMKSGAYQGGLSWQGRELTVNYFHLGRVVFVAQSLNKQENWVWDAAQGSWRSLDDRFGAAITKAIDIANKRTTPSLLELPLLVRPLAEIGE